MGMRTPLQHPYIAEAKNHRFLVGLAALLIVIAGGWYWYSRSAQNSGRERLHPVAVTHGTIEDVVTAQGQLVAEIDPRVYQSQVEATEAHIGSLKAQLAQQKAAAVLAQQNLTRNQNLIAANAVSQQALQETQSQAAVADAQVQALAAQIK